MRTVYKGLGIFLISLIMAFPFPDLSEASPEAAYRHNSRGLEKMQAGDHVGAIEELRAAHRYMPSEDRIKKNLGIAHNNYGFFLQDKGDLRGAVRQYENALQYDRENAYTHYNLGQAYYRLQNMTKAREHLERAYNIDRTLGEIEDLLRKVRTESSQEEGFDRHETMHFTMAVDRAVPVSKVSYIRTHLEEAYGRVGGLLGHYPREKTVAVVFSGDKYEGLLGGIPHWALAIYDGKLRIPADRLNYTRNQVRKIIYHEYAHAVVAQLTGGNCPVWLNEGIAGLAESLVEPKSRNLIRRYLDRFGLISFRNMPGSFANAGSSEQMTFLYINSYLMAEYIVWKVGNQGLTRILQELGKGDNIAAVLFREIGQVEEIDKEFQWYVSSRYGWKGTIS